VKVIRLLRTDLLGVPHFQPGQVDQGLVGAHHAKDMRPNKLPDILDELLKLAPRLVRLLDWGQPRRARLVLGKLGADQIQHRSHSFVELYAIRLLGVPIFDQVLNVLLGVGLEHFDQFQGKKKANSQQHAMAI